MKVDLESPIPDMDLVWFRGTYAAYWREDGEPKRRSLRTKDEGQARRNLADLRKRLEASLEDGTVGGIYRAYMRDLQEKYGEVPDTVYYVWRVLEPGWAHMRPDQITRQVCRDWVKRRRADGKSNGTIRRELVQLAAAVRWHTPTTPAVFEYPPDSEPRDVYLTKDQFVSLRDGAAAGGAPHVYLYMEMAKLTGARMSAILDLRWTQVDLDRRTIRLMRPGQDPEAIMGAKRKPRAVVPITDRMVETLRTYREAALTPYVIEWGGKPIKSIKRAFARSVERASLPDWATPHIVRHSVAVWMAEDGVPMSEIAQYLGHTDERVTARHYARYSPHYLRRAMASVDF